MERNSKGQLKDAIRQEYVKCAQDPAYFKKKYCVIQHPIKGKVPFALYDFQEKTVEDFVSNRFNIGLHQRSSGKICFLCKSFINPFAECLFTIGYIDCFFW